ncbi:type II secretion system protein [Lacimicrobium sp. SS2-24]|uniref:PulJ/GspJ family protein n=1 Tax=Lacimicrobium sp. SS2-24 TaxID=2005569 RepID=UPI000B4BC77C|nr:type II secretion system protein [Lacimicrobium sp. SS2-24]
MQRPKGFTLLEVLVAGVILFMAISSAAIVYSSALKSSESATRAVISASQLSMLMTHIQSQLRRVDSLVDKKGQGYLLGNSYHWVARVQERAKPTPVYSGPEEGFSIPPKDIILWSVSLNVEAESNSRDFQFFVTGWTS